MTISVGVVDSGIGGLSILNELTRKLPDFNYVYIADQGHLPYGNKTPDFIFERVFKMCEFLAKHCDLIVIACNTATALAIDKIRPLFNLPIVGIEPAVKQACAMTHNHQIAICATENMLKSQRLLDLIDRYGTNKTFYKINCAAWVEFVENGVNQLNEMQKEIIIQDIQTKFNGIADKIDQVILGCTHFPFLTHFIEQVLPKCVNLINPAEAIASRVEFLILERYPSFKNTQITLPQKITCYSSHSAERLSRQMQQLDLFFYQNCTFHFFDS